MSQAQQMSANQAGPKNPPPQEDPTHDVPVYPEEDPPPPNESSFAARAEGPEDEGEPRGDPVEPEDVDEDDLDPRKPHHPPDVGKGRIFFDENEVPG
jgi:hypothetical protein